MFEDEIHPELKHTGAGVVSMANSGPNSNGSQYFVTLAPCQWLDGTFYVFESCRFYSCVAKSLREKCPNTAFFWSIFSCIQSEYRKTRTGKNSVFGHFLSRNLLVGNMFKDITDNRNFENQINEKA